MPEVSVDRCLAVPILAPLERFWLSHRLDSGSAGPTITAALLVTAQGATFSVEKESAFRGSVERLGHIAKIRTTQIVPVARDLCRFVGIEDRSVDGSSHEWTPPLRGCC